MDWMDAVTLRGIERLLIVLGGLYSPTSGTVCSLRELIKVQQPLKQRRNFTSSPSPEQDRAYFLWHLERSSWSRLFTLAALKVNEYQRRNPQMGLASSEASSK